MPRLIELGEQAFDAEKIVSIKRGDKKGTIKVWTVGQSAIHDNFLLEEDYDEAIRLWWGDEEDEDDE
jgi:hypothetical protein